MTLCPLRRTSARRLRALFACSLLASVAVVAAPARAQERPGAALLQTSRSRGVEEGTAGAFDRMIRQRIDALDVVRVDGSIALDLEQLQLALGCMGETVSCLEAVSNEVGAPIVIVPALNRAGTELVATLLLFDIRDGAQRRVTRQASGETAPTQILESVDGMLRELFGLPAATVVEDEGGDPDPEPDPEPVVPEPIARPGLSPIPFVLIGTGAAALIAGVVVGAMSQSSADEYRATMPTTTAQVDAALATLSRAETEALAANVLMIAGGVLAAGGVVWLLAAGNEDGSSPLAAAPVVAPGYAGIALTGTFGGSL